MIALHNLKSAEFREQAAQIILETLAHLPETYRNIFVWNHYQGRSVSQIAEMLDWKSPEIEAALDAIGSTLYQRTRGSLAHYPQMPNTFSGDESKAAEESELRKPNPAVGSHVSLRRTG
jgi:sigma-70-like protein